MKLSDTDLARYRHVGHLTVPKLFTAEETDAVVADIQAWGEEFLAELPPAQRAWYVDGGVKARSVLRKLDNPHHHRASVQRLARHPALVEMVESIIGPGVSVYFSQIFFKPPEGGGPKPAHQDNFYFGPNDLDGLVTAWVALDDATLENGCLYFGEGTQPRPGVRARGTGRRALQPAAARRDPAAPADGAGPRAARRRVLPSRQHLPPVGRQSVDALAPCLRAALRQRGHALRASGAALRRLADDAHQLTQPKRTHMSTRRLGIVMNGVTGRMGMNQHLIRSIVAIRDAGGVALANGDRVMPDPVLIGRNAEKIEALAKAHGVARFGTNLDAALDNREDTVFFDAGTTQMRPALLAQALRAGKHVYCEKPIATNLAEAVEVCKLAQASGLKHGAVQDKLFLPGLRKLDMLRRAGFFGRMLNVRIDFGYWVFEGDLQPIQRPSWNYRKEDGGGMILDMMCHWRYVLDNLFGEVQSITCLGATHIPQRWDEAGQPYAATADDAAYATAQLKGHNGEPVVAQLTMSWATRVRRDDLVTFHVDGTHGSAVAGLQECRAQSRVTTPRPVWNPDVKQTMNFFDQWQEVPDAQVYDNGFKIQWEAFIRHVAEDAPYKWTLPEGAKGVQLVEAALQSWKERRWIDVPALEL